MKYSAHLLTVLSTCLITMLLTSAAQAQDAHTAPNARAHLSQLGDPYVPPHVRAAARAKGIVPITSGASLQAQALGKLKKKFNEADLSHTGRITKSQARQTGFGFVVNHFTEIDTRHKGSVSFDELKAFMRTNGARF